METHRHSSYRLTVADIGTEKSRTLVTCSLHELHCSTQNKGWTAEGSRELTKRAIVFPNRKKQLTGQAILLYSFLRKAAPMKKLCFQTTCQYFLSFKVQTTALSMLHAFATQMQEYNV